MTRDRRWLVATIALLLATPWLAAAAPSPWSSLVRVAALGALVAIARASGSTREELGLRAWGRGAAWGGVAALLTWAAVAAAAVFGPSAWFADDRADTGLATVLLSVAVRIPIVTVAVEEFAFRGLLLGLGRRRWRTGAAVAVSSLVFGAWHVAPAIVTADGNAVAGRTSLAIVVTASVLATAAAGAVFCWLRLRSESLLAPSLLHWATNGGALVAAWLLAR